MHNISDVLNMKSGVGCGSRRGLNDQRKQKINGGAERH